VDNNNNTHLSKDERKLLYKKKNSGKQTEVSPSSSRELTNGHHSKNE